MLCKSVDALPEGDGWLFEPKWDGFRALVFRDGDAIHVQSRDEKPMARYFPEIEAAARAGLPPRCVVDGEIVIARDGALDFPALLQRIHPAKSRIDRLARETPASLVVWDVLAEGDDDLMARPFAERRARLETLVRPPVRLTPITTDRALAQDWFTRFEGAGLDGVIAKRAEAAYQPGVRAMLKIKHARTADCVVAGFRWHKQGPGTLLGSLLLGLYDDAGVLHHVGVAASFTMKRRRELVEELAPLREGALEGHPWASWQGGDGEAPSTSDEHEPSTSTSTSGEHEHERKPGMRSRWNANKDLTWEPLRPERVCEVAYDHLEGSRFRHATHFVRWRPDKPPAACRYDQLEVTPAYELGRIFGS